MTTLKYTTTYQTLAVNGMYSLIEEDGTLAILLHGRVIDYPRNKNEGLKSLAVRAAYNIIWC
jgi:hypothetical protein